MGPKYLLWDEPDTMNSLIASRNCMIDLYRLLDAVSLNSSAARPEPEGTVTLCWAAIGWLAETLYLTILIGKPYAHAAN